jgi:hypothetical protein
MLAKLPTGWFAGCTEDRRTDHQLDKYIARGSTISMTGKRRKRQSKLGFDDSPPLAAREMRC